MIETINKTRIFTDKEKAHAVNKVAIAIEQGKLVRNCCEICGEIKTHGHHNDYSKPLNVKWLCPSHHFQLHARLRRSGKTKSISRQAVVLRLEQKTYRQLKKWAKKDKRSFNNLVNLILMEATNGANNANSGSKS